ncbi:hypothetical protein ACFLST_00175 [Chloroflexota bacterium]
MAEVFVITTSHPAAKKHYDDTIDRPVQRDKFEKYLDQKEMQVINQAFQDQPIYAWGAKPGPGNEQTWHSLSPNDYVLVYVQGKFAKLARVAMKLDRTERSRTLAVELWGTDASGTTWEFMYLLKDMHNVDYGLDEFNNDLGFQSNYIPQACGRIDASRYQKFGTFDDFVQKAVLRNSLRL